MPLETEVKLRIPTTEAVRPLLASLGFQEVVPMQDEQSVLWDRGAELFEKGCALRVRSYAGKTLLTWKGPKQPDPLLKIRPETETFVENREALEGILAALGFAPVLRMEKRRATFEREGLQACLDETPFGNYLELEGEPAAIRYAMEHLCLDVSRLEPRSYPTLFLEHGLGGLPGKE